MVYAGINKRQLEWCGFNRHNGSAIWNNDGETATLKNSTGRAIDTCSNTGNDTTVNC